jgi:SAM-dependent methyltransferase
MAAGEPMSGLDYSDGYFYHTIDLPGVPTIAGAWDLRDGVDAYLGGFDLSGQRVLEIGAANGFLSAAIEERGGELVPFDLSPEYLGDIMRRPGEDLSEFEAGYRRVVAGLNRAWAYAKEAYHLKSSLVAGSAYALPKSIGEVDVTLFGSVLLHLKHPYSALEQAAAITRGKIVVTDLFSAPFHDARLPNDHEARSGMLFDPTRGVDPCSWWILSPGAVQRMLRPLGFTRYDVSFHRQTFRPDLTPWGATRIEDYTGRTVIGSLFTIVAQRS